MPQHRNAKSFTSKSAKLALKATEQIEGRRGLMLVSRAAVRFTGYDRTTLRNWARRCPLLGGRKLYTERHPDGFGRPTPFYLLADLDELLARASQVSDEDDQWLSLQRTAKRLRVSRGTVEEWCLHGCPFLGGAKMRSEKRTDRGIAGHVRMAWKADIERADANRNACVKPKDSLTASEVARRMQVSVHAVYRWHDDGCPYLDGARLPGEIKPIISALPNNAIRATLLFAVADIERIERERAKRRKAYQPIVNAEGTWLPGGLAVKKYAGLNHAILAYCRNKRSHWFGGRKLTAKKFLIDTPTGWGTRRWTWHYLEADLERWQKPQPGRPHEWVSLRPFVDDEGTWLPETLACHATRMNERAIQHLGRKGRIRRKRFRNPNAARNRWKTVWGYNQDDLLKLTCKKVGSEAAELRAQVEKDFGQKDPTLFGEAEARAPGIGKEDRAVTNQSRAGSDTSAQGRAGANAGEGTAKKTKKRLSPTETGDIRRLVYEYKLQGALNREICMRARQEFGRRSPLRKGADCPVYGATFADQNRLSWPITEANREHALREYRERFGQLRFDQPKHSFANLTS